MDKLEESAQGRNGAFVKLLTVLVGLGEVDVKSMGSARIVKFGGGEVGVRGLVTIALLGAAIILGCGGAAELGTLLIIGTGFTTLLGTIGAGMTERAD